MISGVLYNIIINQMHRNIALKCARNKKQCYQLIYEKSDLYGHFLLPSLTPAKILN